MERLTKTVMEWRVERKKKRKRTCENMVKGFARKLDQTWVSPGRGRSILAQKDTAWKPFIA